MAQKNVDTNNPKITTGSLRMLLHDELYNWLLIVNLQQVLYWMYSWLHIVNRIISVLDDIL